MKKKCFFILLYFVFSTSASAFAINDSTVLLSGGGTVLPAQSLSIPLTGLVPSANYTIICYIDNTFPFVIVRLSSNLGGAGGLVTAYTLNGNNVVQGQLNVGHNIALISGNFVDPTVSNVVFTNLDQSNSFNVNNCFAMAVVG